MSAVTLQSRGAGTLIANQWGNLSQKIIFDLLDEICLGKTLADAIQTARKGAEIVDRWNLVVYGLPGYYLIK